MGISPERFEYRIIVGYLRSELLNRTGSNFVQTSPKDTLKFWKDMDKFHLFICYYCVNKVFGFRILLRNSNVS